MKVFIGWSGERSRAVARALRDWIPYVIQAADPWMSEEDISKGSRWTAELATELGQASFAIVCVTPENRDVPWLAFEAGALYKALDKTEKAVCPFLLGLERTDLEGPLTLFQMVKAEKEDTLRMMHALNQALGGSVTSDRLDKQFEQWWPQLEKSLDEVRASISRPKPTREVREMVEEILEIVRAQTWNRELSQARAKFLSDLIIVRKIKATLEANRKMMVVTALEKGIISIDDDYLRVDYSPEYSKCKAEIESRDKRIAIEDACEEVLGRRLTLRASIRS